MTMKTTLFIKRLRETKLMLPPLTGFTDYPYRTILADFDPPFLTTEMINARALLQQNQRTLQMIQRVFGSHIQGVQLLGNDPTSMAKAAKIIEDLDFDYIDINMGCTSRKVTSRGEGVSLMNDEQRAYDIVHAVFQAVNIPITVKLRIGPSKNKITISSLSEKVIAAGAVALTIHGRTGEKKFASPIDLQTIKDVVQKVSVPIIANGGIFTGDDAKNVLFKTGAAAVMPGRGLIGNPWIVSEIHCALFGEPFSFPSLQEKKKICLKHTQELCNYYGERRGILHMRKILPKYFSQAQNIKELKRDVQCMATENDITVILGRIEERDSRWYYLENNL